MIVQVLSRFPLFVVPVVCNCKCNTIVSAQLSRYRYKLSSYDYEWTLSTVSSLFLILFALRRQRDPLRMRVRISTEIGFGTVKQPWFQLVTVSFIAHTTYIPCSLYSSLRSTRSIYRNSQLDTQTVITDLSTSTGTFDNINCNTSFNLMTRHIFQFGHLLFLIGFQFFCRWCAQR
jgi:hypothetical protein